jgi:two-component system sensor histidine kinase UhpB
VLHLQHDLVEKVENSLVISAQQLKPQSLDPKIDLLSYLQQLGRVRSLRISLYDSNGQEIYQSPQGKITANAAPAWFYQLLSPTGQELSWVSASGQRLLMRADVSRSIDEAWEMFYLALVLCLVMVLLAYVLGRLLLNRLLADLPALQSGMRLVARGDFQHNLPAAKSIEFQALSDDFHLMSQALQEKQQLAGRLAEQTDLAQIIEQQLEHERLAISHELHDEFGQSVTAMRSLATALARELPDASQQEVAQTIADEAKRLYESMHSLIPRLQPFNLRELDLEEALNNLRSDWLRRHPDLNLSLAITTFKQPGKDLGEQVQVVLYRVCQEALLNVYKHAMASKCSIALHQGAQHIKLMIDDNGQGIEANWQGKGRYGLRAIDERVQQLGGQFSIAPKQLGSGTLLTVVLPL